MNIDEILLQLQIDGWCVVEGVIPSDQVGTARAEAAAQQFFCNFRPVVGQDPPFSYLGRSKGEARTETQETSTLIAGLRKGDPLRWWGSS